MQRVRYRRRDLGVAHRRRQPELGELLGVVAVDQVMHDAGVVRLRLPNLFQDLGGFLLVREGLVGRRLGCVQRQRIEDAGLLVVREAGMDLLHRLFIGDRPGLVVDLVVILVEGGDRRDIGLLAVGLRPGGAGLFDRFGTGFQRGLARRVPQRVPVAHRDAPIGHRAVGLALRDVGKALQRLRIPEGMQRPGGVVERLLRRRAARDWEIDLLDHGSDPGAGRCAFQRLLGARRGQCRKCQKCSGGQVQHEAAC